MQTISTADTASRRDVTPQNEAAIAFGALLTSIALRPLAKPLGFYGDIVVDACALGVARALPQGLLPESQTR